MPSLRGRCLHNCNYCNSLLYGVSHSNIRKVQSVQNATARLLAGTTLAYRPLLARGPHLASVAPVALASSPATSRLQTGVFCLLVIRHCLARHLCTWLTTYIWSRKGFDAGSARLPTDRVLLRTHTTHSVTGVFLLPGHVSGTASQQT